MGWFDSPLGEEIVGGAAVIGGGLVEAGTFGGGSALGIPLITGGLATIGAGMQNSMNQTAATNAENFSAQQAQNQMNFQQYMSNTSYQRTVASMTAAGINPAMAINNGPLSTPSGSSGQGFMPRMENAIGQGVSSATAASQLMNSIKATDSSVNLNKALGVKAMADANTSGMTAKNLNLRNQALSSQLDAIAARAQADKATAGYDVRASGYDAIMNRAYRESGTAGNLSRLYKLFGSDGQMMNPFKNVPRGTTTWNNNTGEIINEN